MLSKSFIWGINSIQLYISPTLCARRHLLKRSAAVKGCSYALKARLCHKLYLECQQFAVCVYTNLQQAVLLQQVISENRGSHHTPPKGLQYRCICCDSRNCRQNAVWLEVRGSHGICGRLPATNQHKSRMTSDGSCTFVHSIALQLTP